jgi:hypothetical protein
VSIGYQLGYQIILRVRCNDSEFPIQSIQDHTLSSPTMSATLGNLPLSTMFDANEKTSRLSLDWVLRTGIKTTHAGASGILTIPGVEHCSTFSLQILLPVSSSLPVDLVLGRDWMRYCQANFPAACLTLSSGVIQLGISFVSVARSTHMCRRKPGA